MSVTKWVSFLAGKPVLNYNESLHHNIQRNLMRDRVAESYYSPAKFPGVEGTGEDANYADIFTVQIGIRTVGPNWAAEMQRRGREAGTIPEGTTTLVPTFSTYGPLSPNWGE